MSGLVGVVLGGGITGRFELQARAGDFPTIKAIEQFDLAASSIAAPTWAYLTSLEWIRAKENLTLSGRPGPARATP